MQRKLRLPSPAMVVALVALFVALTGGAAAGTFLAAKQDSTVRANTMQQASLVRTLTHKLGLSSTPRGVHFASRCCRGPRGRRGPQGPPGPAGGFTTANITYVSGPVTHLCQFGGGDCAVGASVAACPTGKVAIGGGWIGDTPDPPVSATVGADAASSDSTSWSVVMINDTSATTASFHAFAACAG
jgi:uncharacterized protein YneF (UPF0154 family)